MRDMNFAFAHPLAQHVLEHAPFHRSAESTTFQVEWFDAYGACTNMYRRVVSKHIQSAVNQRGSDLLAPIAVFLHACRLDGFYDDLIEGNTQRKEANCAAPNAPAGTKTNVRTLTTAGGAMCTAFKTKLIAACKTTNQKDDAHCTSVFVDYLSMTAHGTKFEAKQSSHSLGIIENYLGVNTAATFSGATAAGTAAPGTAGVGGVVCTPTSVVFNTDIDDERIKSNVKRLIGGAGAAGSYFTSPQFLIFLEAVGKATSRAPTTLPARREHVHEKIYTFLVAACKEVEDCLVRFFTTTKANQKWPTIYEQGGNSDAWKKWSKDLAASLIGFLPCLTQKAYTKVRQLAVLPDTLFEQVKKRHFFFSWTSVQAALKVIIGDREPDMSYTRYRPMKTSQDLRGAQIALGRSVEHLLNSPVSHDEIWSQHKQEWLVGRIGFAALTLEDDEECLVANAPKPTNNHYNFVERNKWICKCVVELKDMGTELCPLAGRGGGAPSLGKLQDFSWMTVFTRGGTTPHFFVYVQVPIPIWLYVVDHLDEVAPDVCPTEDSEITNDHKYLGDLLLKAKDHMKLIIDYGMYCDIDSCDAWRKPNDDKSSGSLTSYTCCSTNWLPNSGLHHQLDLCTIAGLWDGKDSLANLNGHWDSTNGLQRIREDKTAIIQTMEDQYVGFELKFSLDSMASQELGGGGACRGSPPHDISGRPRICRVDGRFQMDPLNQGGLKKDRVVDWKNERCGVSFSFKVYNHIKHQCKPVFRLTPGYDHFRIHNSQCLEALANTDRESPAWKTQTETACQEMFNMFKPTKQWDRANQKKKQESWGCSKLGGYCRFWCDKSNKKCTEFFVTYSSAFYAIPPLNDAANAAARAAAVVVVAPVADVGAGAAMTADDVAQTPNDDGAEAAAEVEEEEEDEDDMDENRNVFPTETEVFQGGTVIANDVGGYYKMLPSLGLLDKMRKVHEDYVDEYKWLKSNPLDARKVAKQNCVQDPAVFAADITAMEEKMNGMPIDTVQERKDKKKLQDLLIKKKKNGVLPGLWTFKQDLDENLGPHSKCKTKTGPGFDEMYKLVKDIVDLDIVAATGGNAVKNERAAGQRMTSVINQKVGNALTLMKKNIDGKVPMIFTRGSNILGELQFRQDVLGESCVVDSLHCGLRCIGTTMTTAWISDISILDKKCTLVGKSRLKCVKEEVVSKCGTYVALEMNGNRLIIKKNGGHHFNGCLFDMDMSKCFRESTDQLAQNLAPTLCAAEEETKLGWEATQKVARFIHWFSFMSNDRKEDFGYNEDLLDSINDHRYEEGLQDPLTMSELIRSELSVALHYIYNMFAKLRPLTKLTLTRKNSDGTNIVITRNYDFANTRSCRSMGIFMLELYDQCIDTSLLNADMGERMQGIVRLIARHYVMKGLKTAEQVVKYHDTHTRIATQVKGWAASVKKAYAKSEPRRRAKYNPQAIRAAMLVVVATPVNDRFSGSYVPCVTHAENQEIMIEINEGVIGGMVVENREDNVGLTEADQEMDAVAEPANEVGGPGEVQDGDDF